VSSLSRLELGALRYSWNALHLPASPHSQDRGAVIEMSNGAFSNYHALQLSSTKRLRGTGLWNGMALTGSYTWSHMTDNASEVFGPSVLTLPSAPGPAFLDALFNFDEPFETSTPFPQNASDPRKGEKKQLLV